MSSRRLSQAELDVLTARPPGARKLSAPAIHAVSEASEASGHDAAATATVWDEDDIEALRVAQTLQQHASVLFPRRPSGESSASASTAAGVRSLIGAWESRAKSPDVVLRSPDVVLRTPRSPPSLSPPLRPAALVSPRLSIRQSAMLSKALRSMRSNEAADVDALAKAIVTAKAADDEFDLIDDYFEAADRKPPAPIPAPVIPRFAVPLRSDSAEPPVLPERSVSASPQPPDIIIQKPQPSVFTDIHDPPRRPSQIPTTSPTSPSLSAISSTAAEVEYRPPTLQMSRALMNRRMTVKKVDSIRKHASTMNASKLILELDTVMSEISMFGTAGGSDDGLSADGLSDRPSRTSSFDDISSTELVGNGWGFDEDEDEDVGDDEVVTTYDTLERTTSRNSDPDLATQTSAARHPAHLVRHLDRASVYTASEIAVDERMERMDSVREEEDVTEDLTSELSNLAPVAKKPLELSSARLDSRESRYATAMPHPSASVSPPTSPQIQTSPRSQTSPTRNTGTVKRTGLSLFPSPPGSTGSRSSGRASTDLPSVVVQRPTVKRNVSTPPPQAPADIPRPSSPFQPRPNSPSFFSKRSTTPTAPSMSSPAPHFQTLSRSINTAQSSYNPAANSSLLNSEDDPDAISGQLKLHTSKMFNAWQEIVLVLSPRKRGLYYVKTGKGAGRTEQVVGFIELNHRTEVESIGNQGGVANVFRGKPTFKVVKVKELDNGLLRKEYFYFLASKNEDRDRWVDAMQGFVESLKQLEAQPRPSASVSIHTFTQSESRPVTPNYYSQSMRRQQSILTQEDISIQLQKQQKLLAQQKALMAAVAQQLQLQQEITAELQAAQNDNRRLSIQTGDTGGSGGSMHNTTNGYNTNNNNGPPFPGYSGDSGIGGSQNNSGNGRKYSVASSSNSAQNNNNSGSQRQFQHKEPLHPYPEMSRTERDRRSSNNSSDILDPYNLLGRKRSTNQFQNIDEEEFIPPVLTRRSQQKLSGSYGESMQRGGSSPGNLSSHRVGSPSAGVSLDQQYRVGVPMARTMSAGVRAGSPILNPGTRSYTAGVTTTMSRPASPMVNGGGGGSRSVNLGASRAASPVVLGKVGVGLAASVNAVKPYDGTAAVAAKPEKRKMFPLFGRSKSTK